MEWLTIDIVNNAKIYSSDQYTKLIKYQRDDKSYYILRGNAYNGKVNNMEIIVESFDEITEHSIIIKVLCVSATYFKSVDSNKEKMQSSLFLELFKENLKVYISSNFMLWSNTPLLTKKEFYVVNVYDVFYDISFSDKQLIEIKNASVIISKIHNNRLQLSFDIIKNITINNITFSGVKCAESNNDNFDTSQFLLKQ